MNVRKGNFLMMTRQTRARKKYRPWLLMLLFLPFALTLWPGFYNTIQPEFIGIPFFYWFPMLCVLITSALMAILYYFTD